MVYLLFQVFTPSLGKAVFTADDIKADYKKNGCDCVLKKNKENYGINWC